MYPAFFGGPLAVTLLGAINARRLRLTGTKVALIVAAGVVALIAQVTMIALLREASSGVQRFSYSLAGVAAWGVVLFLQRRPFRIFLMRGGEPAKLLGPGIAAVIGSAIVQFILVTLVNQAVNQS